MTPLLPLLALALAGPPDTAAVAPSALLAPLEAQVPWARPEGVPPRDPPARVAWADRPVARGIHPVGYHYGRRYQELVASIMGGPRASPVFGPVVAEADVHWRLMEATGRGIVLDADAANRWRDAAVAGSLLSFERLVDETVQRAPTLYGVYIAGDTLLSPSFDVRRTGEDAIELAHRPGGAAARAVERAEEELALGRPRGKPTPAFGAGLDWELRDEEAPESAPFVRYTAWFSTTEIWLSSFRVEVAPVNLAWAVSARQQLAPRFFLIGTARSDELGPDPGRVAGGLMWVTRPPGTCNVRAERILDYLSDDERWMVSLRCENRTRIPAPLAPPLGDRGRPGRVLPWAPEREPIDVAPTAATSASGATR